MAAVLTLVSVPALSLPSLVAAGGDARAQLRFVEFFAIAIRSSLRARSGLVPGLVRGVPFGQSRKYSRFTLQPGSNSFRAK